MSLPRVSGLGIAREIEIALQVLDAVVPDGRGSYLAGPISTGRRYFEALGRSGTVDLAGLIGAIGEDEYLRAIRWPNVDDGQRLAATLREAGVNYLINTGPIMIDGWAGRDYMDLCFRLIEQKVKTVYFHPEWAYSTGAVQEYLFCRERGMTLSTADGRPLTRAIARDALQSAEDHIGSLGVSCPTLERALAGFD